MSKISEKTVTFKLTSKISISKISIISSIISIFPVIAKSSSNESFGDEQSDESKESSSENDATSSDTIIVKKIDQSHDKKEAEKIETSMTKNQIGTSVAENSIISAEGIIISRHFIKISSSSNCDFVYIVFISIIRFRKRKHSAMNFETFFSAFVSNAHFFLKDTFKLEKSHDFQSWLSDIIIAVQIVNCFSFLESDTFSDVFIRSAVANSNNRAWIIAQTVVKSLILSIVGRETRKSLQQKKIAFQMITELKNRFIKKDGFRVTEIHEKFRSITLKIFIDIHDFVAKLRIYNDDLTIIHSDYAFRKWEMNLHFVNHLTDAYDSFITDLLTADNDFIEIGKKMDWQTLVNKAAEIESKAKSRRAHNLLNRILDSVLSREQMAHYIHVTTR